MTDSINGVFVTFDEDIRIDDAEGLIQAIKMMRRVLDVTPNVSDSMGHVATVRAKQVIAEKLFAVLRES